MPRVSVIYAGFAVHPIVFLLILLVTAVLAVTACIHSRGPARLALIILLTGITVATPLMVLKQFQDNDVPRTASYWYLMAGYVALVVICAGGSIVILVRARTSDARRLPRDSGSTTHP
jgi:hypothetical protein